MMRPVASLIIPTYRRTALLQEAIDSVLSTGDERLEIVVIDDASLDETRHAVNRFGSRVRYVAVQHGGLAKARNAGLRAASGDIVLFLDDDDGWIGSEPLKLIDALVSHNDLDWVVADAVYGANRQTVTGMTQTRTGFDDFSFLRHEIVAPSIVRLERQGLFEALIRRNLFTIGAWAARRSVLMEVGGFESRLTHAEDWQMYLKLASKFTCAALMNSQCVWIRTHPTQMSSDHDRMRRGFVQALGSLSSYPLNTEQRLLVRDALHSSSLGIAYDLLLQGRGKECRTEIRNHVARCGLGVAATRCYLASWIPTKVLHKARALKQTA